MTSQQVTNSLSGLSLHDTPVSRPAQPQPQRPKGQQPAAAAAEAKEGSKASKSQAKRLRKKLREGRAQATAD